MSFGSDGCHSVIALFVSSPNGYKLYKIRSEHFLLEFAALFVEFEGKEENPVFDLSFVFGAREYEF